SKNLGTLTSANMNQVEVNKNYVTTGSIMYDAVYVPGGFMSVENIKTQGDAIHFINEAYRHAKTIAASNEGVDLLGVTAVQGMIQLAAPGNQTEVVSQMGVVTVKNTKEMNSFSQEFIHAIAGHRHWARENQKDWIPA
ncbi:MAG: catalase HPII, partial [Syntrophomonadaceae bacterium]|nr:catalase HPII [Syntrophomonadaceae bacterium]